MDLQKVSEDRLSKSQFRIRSEAYLVSGQRIDLGTLVLKPSELENEDDNEYNYNRNRVSVDNEYEDRDAKDVILNHQ